MKEVMKMAYINISAASKRWGISERRVQELCRNGAVKGATRFGRAWMIPENAQKPADGRSKAFKQSKDNIEDKFLLPCPKENSFLIHTDLYNTAGAADSIIASYTDFPETARIIKAQFDCRRGNINDVYKISKHLLENHKGFYSTISAGVTLSFVAIWKGDINLWRKARQHIYNAPIKTENELEIIKFWVAVVDSNIHDLRSFPNWFYRGNFDCLPFDSLCTARVFYAKRLFIEASELASGKISFPNVEKLGLMRSLPFVLEPMASQAKAEKTIIPEIYLRLMLAETYYILGNYESAIPHIDRAIDLCLPDRLFGILAEYSTNFLNFSSDRLLLKDAQAAAEVKRLHKPMQRGWIKLHNFILERSLSNSLTVREREIARLAAMGVSNAEISQRLHIELSSVKQYIFSAMNKVGVQKRNELGMFV